MFSSLAGKIKGSFTVLLIYVDNTFQELILEELILTLHHFNYYEKECCLLSFTINKEIK